MADKVRHLRARRLKTGWGWYWIPSAHVAALGLHAEALGTTPDGHPTPAILKRAFAVAIARAFLDRTSAP